MVLSQWLDYTDCQIGLVLGVSVFSGEVTANWQCWITTAAAWTKLQCQSAVMIVVSPKR